MTAIQIIGSRNPEDKNMPNATMSITTILSLTNNESGMIAEAL